MVGAGGQQFPFSYRNTKRNMRKNFDCTSREEETLFGLNHPVIMPKILKPYEIRLKVS